MTPAEALRDIRGYAGAGRVELTKRERMRQRGMRIQDVLHALTYATECRRADEAGKWKTTGTDLDGDDLTAVVAFVGGVLVITVF